MKIISKLEGSDGSRTIAVHSGPFHADDAMSAVFLGFLPQFADFDVLRTRDMEQINACHIAVDVGGEYDASRLRFDHHQRGFDQVFGEDFTIKLSGAGLIWKHFGIEIIAQLYPELDQSQKQVLRNKMYEGLVSEIDAIDNGINVSEGEQRYHISTSLSSRIGRLGPSWREDSSDELYCVQFGKAMELARQDFLDILKGKAEDWLPARSIVKEAMDAKAGDAEGKVIFLSQYCPWKTHLHELEEEQGVFGRTKFVILLSDSGQWRVNAVPISLRSFDLRESLRKEWCGLRGDELSSVSGIEGCVFIHPNGFTGGCTTREGAFSMAMKSLEE